VKKTSGRRAAGGRDNFTGPGKNSEAGRENPGFEDAQRAPLEEKENRKPNQASLHSQEHLIRFLIADDGGGGGERRSGREIIKENALTYSFSPIAFQGTGWLRNVRQEGGALCTSAPFKKGPGKKSGPNGHLKHKSTPINWGKKGEGASVISPGVDRRKSRGRRRLQGGEGTRTHRESEWGGKILVLPV